MRRVIFLSLEIALTALACRTPATAQTWVNESNAAAEADFAALGYPSSLTVQLGQSTGLIYGQLYELGLTEPTGVAPNVLADLGYGPAGSDPRTSGGWTWTAAYYASQSGATDQFQAAFTAPSAGLFSYSYRFSLDNGISWTAADLDAAGANAGLSFSASQLGSLTVVAPPTVDLDVTKLQYPAALSKQAGQSTGLIYGLVFEPGLTSLPGEWTGLTAHIGYGPAGSDPRSSAYWTWTGANYEGQLGASDSYVGAFAAPALNGNYAFTMRFSVDGGLNWTVGDLDGYGSASETPFSLNQLGLLTVTGGINPTYAPSDFNHSGFVEGTDLTMWRNGYGLSAAADANGDGRTDGADFLRWQRALGSTSGAAASSVDVPEPVGLGLAVGAGSSIVALSRRGRGTSRRSA